MYRSKAIETIRQSICDKGILASAERTDNYARVWSRDGVMAGISGLLTNDSIIIKAFKITLESLARNQTKLGQIPSNVYWDSTTNTEKASFGTISGRVDATTWWIIGSCIYGRMDKEFALENKQKIYQALQIIESWEMNNAKLIHTPMGGNWADEFVTYGYTLYDNCLRYWATKLVADIYEDFSLNQLADIIAICIKSNFDPRSENTDQMHRNAFLRVKDRSPLYMFSSFSADGYIERWDMAGNALAILLGLNDSERIETFLNKQFSHALYPVFYPPITEESHDWKLLSNNYNYQFKNYPYHFHNAGSWPIFLGWLSLGMTLNDRRNQAEKIKLTLEQLMSKNKGKEFKEYWNIKTLEPGGTNHLCFSAAGYLLMSEIDILNVKTKILW